MWQGGQTALMAAAGAGHHLVVELILEAGALAIKEDNVRALPCSLSVYLARCLCLAVSVSPSLQSPQKPIQPLAIS